MSGPMGDVNTVAITFTCLRRKEKGKDLFFFSILLSLSFSSFFMGWKNCVKRTKIYLLIFLFPLYVISLATEHGVLSHAASKRQMLMNKLDNELALKLIKLPLFLLR